MVSLQTYAYKEIDVEIQVSTWGVFSAGTVGHLLPTEGLVQQGFDTFVEAKRAIEKRIDTLMDKPPKTWTELTQAIIRIIEPDEDYIVSADKNIIECLIKDFLKRQTLSTKWDKLPTDAVKDLKHFKLVCRRHTEKD